MDRTEAKKRAPVSGAAVFLLRLHSSFRCRIDFFFFLIDHLPQVFGKIRVSLSLELNPQPSHGPSPASDPIPSSSPSPSSRPDSPSTNSRTTTIPDSTPPSSSLSDSQDFYFINVSPNSSQSSVAESPKPEASPRPTSPQPILKTESSMPPSGTTTHRSPSPRHFGPLWTHPARDITRPLSSLPEASSRSFRLKKGDPPAVFSSEGGPKSPQTSPRPTAPDTQSQDASSQPTSHSTLALASPPAASKVGPTAALDLATVTPRSWVPPRISYLTRALAQEKAESTAKNTPHVSAASTAPTQNAAPIPASPAHHTPAVLPGSYEQNVLPEHNTPPVPLGSLVSEISPPSHPGPFVSSVQSPLHVPSASSEHATSSLPPDSNPPPTSSSFSQPTSPAQTDVSY